MLIHTGSTVDSGHYFSYVRASNNDWYIFNDHSVKKTDKHVVLKQKPYLLFYEKLIERPKKLKTENQLHGSYLQTFQKAKNADINNIIELKHSESKQTSTQGFTIYSDSNKYAHKSELIKKSKYNLRNYKLN